MTRGELLDNIAHLFILFISILMTTSYNRFICFQKMDRHGLAVVFVLDNEGRLVCAGVIGKKE